MDPASALVLPLSDASALGNSRVGGKAAKLSSLIAFEYRVPRGFCIATEAYRRELELNVPLAAPIAECRGGMLIHGAIIARELGIPCVNGVSDAILETGDGEIVAVDGHFGIVTIGAPEFDLEARAHAAPGERFE